MLDKMLSVLFWLTVVFYALSLALFWVNSIFKNKKFLERAIFITKLGFITHTVIVTIRWIDTGFPPFVSYFEAMSASVWFCVLGFIFIQQVKDYLKPVGAGIFPFVVLLMGWAGTHPFGGKVLPVSLQSFWLFIHASFATSAVGCFIIAAGMSAVRLYKTRKNNLNNNRDLFAKYDDFSYRLILLGFLFYGIMIISGAIWADVAWGRYWGWDPIEVWSLITWLIYAIYLHIYFTIKKLRGKFLAWYAFIAVFLAAFSLWGVGIVYRTLHTYGAN